MLNRYQYFTDTCCVHYQDRRVLVIWEHFILYLLLSLHISEMEWSSEVHLNRFFIWVFCVT